MTGYISNKRTRNRVPRKPRYNIMKSQAMENKDISAYSNSREHAHSDQSEAPVGTHTTFNKTNFLVEDGSMTSF